jgi:hypothetical protein
MDIKMAKISLVVLTVFALGRFAGAADVSLGALGGGQLLESKSTGNSHGPLIDEVTLGRTLLAGILVDAGVDRRHHFTLELALGPYHNDVDRSCVVLHPGECRRPPRPVFVATSHAFLYGLQYSFAFRRQGHRPFVGCGVGVKHYVYDDSPELYRYEQHASLTLHAALGVEFAGKRPVRLETRGALVRHNPYLMADGYIYETDPNQLELQVLASIRFRIFD